MKTEEYKDLINAVWHQMNSVKSSVGDAEYRAEIAHLESWLKQLREANCPRASLEIKGRALDAQLLAAKMIDDARKTFDAADAAFVRMASAQPTIA